MAQRPITPEVSGARADTTCQFLILKISLKPKYEITQRCTTSSTLLQVRRQSLLDFYLIQTCSRSMMKAIARARLPTPEQCALFALQKRGLAFNFSPPGLMESRSTCIVCDCPEFETLTSLKKDLRYDYYSLYGNPLPSINHTCIPKVGVFLLHLERLNFSHALNSCRTKDSELAHVISETRTTALSALVKQMRVSRAPKRAYIGLDDTKVEGRFVTTTGEPLNCFDYVAWAPSEPRDRLADEDCVALGGNKQWQVSRCSAKLPYLCELWPGGDQPADTTIRLTKCAELQNSGERKSCFDGDTPASKTNKFKRCWSGIKYMKKLPSVFKWDVHFRTAQNGTEKAMTPQNGTENATSSQNRTEKPSVM
ncbi:hypothetical protein B7P43_G12960 [Cryptotermes secundus]|uniref:C-type lectin domain-containing protein n=1 Tax=Cryptotermes secundus TaxID=105785 RepID=A0A2J7QVU4_9NEOP|nr:uncharacterized protein LOC117282353 [Cryptotermes secundus]PNF32703.1 hypothetical protein B7P43_G12960 [Cryptotermes secundus]